MTKLFWLNLELQRCLSRGEGKKYPPHQGSLSQKLNPSRSLVFIIPEAVWRKKQLKLTPNWSVWNWHQAYPKTKDVDWWRHDFTHVTHVYFTEQKSFVLTSAKTEKWRHQWSFLVKETYWWELQVDNTYGSQDLALSLFFYLNICL